ncbi:MAG: CoA-transferase [Collinsella intestinalis]
MFYRAVPIDTVLIRGTVCDEMGNLTTTEEAMKLEVFNAVLAAKRFGGQVIAQVKHVVKNGTINPKDVTVPGVFIDKIVVCDDPETEHRQTHSFFYDASYCGQMVVPETAIETAPFNERKFIARRGVMEMYPGCVVNLGTGIPNDMVGRVAQEEASPPRSITVERHLRRRPDGRRGLRHRSEPRRHGEPPRAIRLLRWRGVDVTYMGLGESTARVT